MPLQVIAFDADDTLWVNEPFFRQAEMEFAQLLEDYLPLHATGRELLRIELQNLPLYGYGIKGFMLSMVEAALEITGNTLPAPAVGRLLEIGKTMLAHPVELLEDVEEVLTQLKARYRLVVATKGDLVDQERKLKLSGLSHHFHHIEIMSDKREADYAKLLRHLDIAAEEFLMVGNSLKSDVLPVLALGGQAVHVPFHTTWAHETIDHAIEHPNFREVTRLRELLALLG